MTGSWRVPFFTGSGSLRVVAEQDLGDFGPGKAESQGIEWQCYYQLPPLLVWSPVIIFFLCCKVNRNWRTATILIPALLVNLLARPLFLSLLPFNAEARYYTGFEINSFVAALTSFWLSTPLLVKSRRPLATLFAFMFVLGLAAHIGNYGTLYLGAYFPEYMLFVVTFFLAIILSRICCRKKYQPRRFWVWMLVWTILFAGFIGPPLFILIRIVSTAILMWPHADYSILFRRFLDLSMFLLAPNCMIGGVIAYLLNLPFVFWILRYPYYHECLQKILGLPVAQRLLPAQEVETVG
jgi:hypothetical protein